MWNFDEVGQKVLLVQNLSSGQKNQKPGPRPTFNSIPGSAIALDEENMCSNVWDPNHPKSQNIEPGQHFFQFLRIKIRPG